MSDMLNLVTPRVAIVPQVAVDSTAIVGEIIDRLGYGGLLFAIGLGTFADPDATFAVTLTVGDVANLSDGVAAPAGDMVGTLTLAGFTFAATKGARKLQYIGSKRYARLTITPTGNDLMSSDEVPVAAASAPVCAIALLFDPLVSPTPNPPV